MQKKNKNGVNFPQSSDTVFSS